MREILFRAKKTSDGEWVEGLLRRMFNGVTEEFEYHIDTLGFDVTPNVYVVDESTIGQYTGLDDVEGNRIFDNEILVDKYGEKTLVKYIDGCHHQCTMEGKPMFGAIECSALTTREVKTYKYRTFNEFMKDNLNNEDLCCSCKTESQFRDCTNFKCVRSTEGI